jgi:hypothetical protein
MISFQKRRWLKTVRGVLALVSMLSSLATNIQRLNLQEKK